MDNLTRKKTDRYNSSGIYIEDRIKSGRTLFFKEREDAIENAIYKRSYIQGCYVRKKDYSFDLVGWVVPL